MKKMLLCALVLLVSFALVWGGGSKENSADGKNYIKLRVAHHAGLSGLLVAAADQGHDFFEDEGLKIEWLKFTAGPPEVAAMVSGDLQFGYIGHGAHNLAAEGTINIIAIQNLGNSERILVRKDSGINSVADLKGKKVATQLGTSGEVILNLALKKNNMTREDIQLYNMDMAGAVAAFVSGQVNAISCWDVHVTNVMNNVGEANMKIIASTDQFSDLAAFPASWVVTPKYAAENEEVVLKFIRALKNTYDWYCANFDDAMVAAAKFGDISLQIILPSKDMATYFTGEQFKDMAVSGDILKIYEKQLDYFKSTGVVKNQAVKASDYVRTDLMKKALQNK